MWTLFDDDDDNNNNNNNNNNNKNFIYVSKWSSTL